MNIHFLACLKIGWNESKSVSLFICTTHLRFIMFLIACHNGLNFYVLYVWQCESDCKRRKAKIGSSQKSDIQFFKTIFNDAYISTNNSLITWIKCQGIWNRSNGKKNLHCKILYGLKIKMLFGYCNIPVHFHHLVYLKISAIISYLYSFLIPTKFCFQFVIEKISCVYFLTIQKKIWFSNIMWNTPIPCPLVHVFVWHFL